MKTKPIHSARLALLLLPLALAGLSGCVLAAAGAGAGVVAYVRGELKVSLPNDYESVVAASRAAIKDLQFVPVSERKDALKAEFIARTALDKKVEISLENSSKQLTSIKIRVGIIGDEQLSLAVLDKIKGRL